MAHVVWLLKRRRRVPALVIGETEDMFTCLYVDEEFVDETDGVKVAVAKSMCQDFMEFYTNNAEIFKKSDPDAADFLKVALRLAGMENHPDAQSEVSDSDHSGSQSEEADASSEEEPEPRRPARGRKRKSSDDEEIFQNTKRPVMQIASRARFPVFSRDWLNATDQTIAGYTRKMLPRVMAMNASLAPDQALVEIGRLDPLGIYAFFVSDASLYSLTEQRTLCARLKSAIAKCLG